MSKERELLKEIYDDEITMMELPFSTATKLQELLAQPEPEQQPEAWIIVNKETGYRTQVSDLTPFLYNREIFEVIPLYTAPPKQEPLGTQVSFKDSSGKLITVDISFVRELVERDSEVSSEGTWHRKGYKDRSWGI